MKRKATTPSAETEALFAQLFPLAPTKGQRRIVSILEAAIECYATVGIDGTTFDTIAKAAGASRPLVQHYFATKRDILMMVVKYVRAAFQGKAIAAIRAESDPAKQLDAYVHSTFDWIHEKPTHALVWKLFYYYCGFDAEFRAINTELVRMGESRIAALLAAGRKAGTFGRSPATAAKQLQAHITGALLTLTTENHSADDTKAFREATIHQCRRIAGSNS